MKRLTKILSVPDRHRRRVAIQTLKMSDVGAAIMGGMTKEEARAFLRSIGDAEVVKILEGE